MRYKVYLSKDIQRSIGLLIDDSLIPDEGPLESDGIEQWPSKKVKSHNEITATKQENKHKTYLEDFLDKFPDCEKDDLGIPFICRKRISSKPVHCTKYGYNCQICWNEKMEEEDR